MNEFDATYTYRGYRLQALYVLDRVLTSTSGVFFTPEGIEDLSISTKDSVIEIVQVKSYSGLVLSDLEPSKPNSFFYRVSQYIKENNNIDIAIVNIGSIGPELKKAWTGEGKERESVKNKLYGYSFTDDDVENFFDRIKILSLDEKTLKERVNKKIVSIFPGIDNEPAFDLLQKWLFDLSESRKKISQNDLIEKIQHVGKFLNDRSQYHSQWFTNIIPVALCKPIDVNSQTLKDEFFAGVSARFEHIFAGLDFDRPRKMEVIEEGFTNENIVIIHGASGQGKSALAYRYLLDYYPEQLRYQIKLIQDRQHALEVTRALSGYAEALKTPIIIYLDVSPRDQDWTELLVQLMSHPFIKILVTVREEDFRRANLPNNVQFADVSLELSKNEAENLYQRAKERKVSSNYLSFEDSWKAFGEKGGPLLEYIYLLTQTDTLRRRLEEQIKRLRNEVREKKLSSDELELLKISAVVNAYEGRIQLSTLLSTLKLPEPSTTLQNYENEYLIRISDDKQYVEALHPIRSKILVDLLIDPGIDSWSDIAEKALPMTLESDWEVFLLNAYVLHSDIITNLVTITMGLSPKTWSGIAGVLRCLLWLGIKGYLQRNHESIDSANKVMGSGLAWMIIDLNFIEDSITNNGWWETLSDNLIPKAKKDEIKKIREVQTPKGEVFELANTWFSNQKSPDKQPQTPPQTPQDWQDVSEVFYWSSRMNLATQVNTWIQDESIKQCIESLDLVYLSNFLFAIYLSKPERYWKLLKTEKEKIVLRLAREYKIFMLEENEDTLVTHYLSYPEEIEVSENEDDGVDKVHSGAMSRIELVRGLFPNFERYESRGYGHKIPGLNSLPDESKKTGIPSMNLPPMWPVRLNAISIGLIRNQTRLETWEDYVECLINIRQSICSDFEQILKYINRFFQNDRAQDFIKKPPFSTGKWQRDRLMICDLPSLPKVSIDPWGIGQPEGKPQYDEKLKGKTRNQLTNARSSVLQRKYRSYLVTEREYFSGLINFYDQAIHASAINIRCGKEIKDSPQQKAILDQLELNGINSKFPFLSKVNLVEAFAKLKNYQSEFRKLLGEKVNEGRLNDLEKCERNILERLLWAWILFIDNPRIPLRDPNKQIPQMIEDDIREIKEGIQKTISSPELSFGETKILNADVGWENQSAIWIQLDVDLAIEMNSKMERLIYLLRENIGISAYGKELYSVIDTYFRYLMIVPTLRGKTIDGYVYPLKISITILQQNRIEDKPNLYVPRKVSLDTLKKVGIDVWGFEIIKALNDFVSALSTFYIQLNMLAQIRDMPRIPDELTEEFDKYFVDRSEELTKSMQLFRNSNSVVLEYLETNIKEDSESNELLNKITQILSNLDEEVIPNDGKIYIFSKQLPEYIKKLQDLLPSIENIKLIVIDEVIKKLV
jgi:hypothetical protein